MPKLHIEYQDYQPGKNVIDEDDFALQSTNEGWKTVEDAKREVEASLEHVLSTLKAGDKLSIIIEVKNA